MTLDLTIGLVGAVASVVGLLLRAPDWMSRLVHALYGLVVALLAGGMVYWRSELLETQRLEQQASRLLSSFAYLNHSVADAGQCRGSILSGLTFLEKSKDRFPDSYAIAKEMATKAGVTEPRPDALNSEYRWRLCQAAEAFRAHLHGIAVGAASDR